MPRAVFFFGWLVLLAGAAWGQVPGHALIGERIPCANGRAGGFPCRDVDLLAFLPIRDIGGRPDTRLNDIWGWEDPETGKEYALVGRTDGTAFVDISDPENPVYLGELPFHTNPVSPDSSSTWRDLKVYQNHVFVVADAAGSHGMQVFDLTQLRDVQAPPVQFAETVHYSLFGSSHNIFINEETGYAYAVGIQGMQGVDPRFGCGPGLHMIDIRVPADPQFAGCFLDVTTGGRTARGYSHDVQCVIYRGPDTEHHGKEICVGSNELWISIADVSDKTNPVALSKATYPTARYVHQGWFTEDQRYFLQDDELDELDAQLGLQGTRTIIWDLSDLDDPVVLTEYIGVASSIDHNQYIVGNHVFQANYTSGLRILDISTISEPIEVAFFDTYPADDELLFDGAWSNYPFFENGIVIVSSIGQGLFVLQPTIPDLDTGTEIASFTAEVVNGDVLLSWETTSETENAGFEVQRKRAGGNFETADFVEGQGTTQERQTYTYRTEELSPGRYTFRLKQVREGGTFKYSSEVEIVIEVPGAYLLSSVYPNPFSGEARIMLAVREEQRVRIEVFDALGRRVVQLQDGVMPAGETQYFTFEAGHLPNGIYFIRAAGESFSQVQTVTLVR